ncbi:hypothetical protein ACIA5C_16765 [Actinoplanes sp. NPDC051343]|uniref:hypothetical protein n=1 Tax=Actinoplanes sp. NPDC051343 TaxID=3363906 RepID=UPI00379AC92E
MSEKDGLQAGIDRLEAMRKDGAIVHQSMKDELHSPEREVLQKAYLMRDEVIAKGRNDLLPKAEAIIQDLEEKEQAARDAGLASVLADEQAKRAIAQSKDAIEALEKLEDQNPSATEDPSGE